MVGKGAEHVIVRGLLLRKQGSDYCCFPDSSPTPKLQGLPSHRQKTPLQSHTQKILNTIGQIFDLVTRETGGGKEKREKGECEKNSVLLHLKQPCSAQNTQPKHLEKVLRGVYTDGDCREGQVEGGELCGNLHLSTQFKLLKD